MQAVDSVGSTTSLLLEQLREQSQSDTSRRGVAAGPPEGFYQQVQSAAAEAGLDASELTSLRSNLEDAVESAVRNGEGPEGVRAAIERSLKEAGIDPSDLSDRLSKLRGASKPPPPPPPATADKQGEASTLLDALAEEDDEQLDGDLGATLLEQLRNLPVGTLYDTEA